MLKAPKGPKKRKCRLKFKENEVEDPSMIKMEANDGMNEVNRKGVELLNQAGIILKKCKKVSVIMERAAAKV